jgi:hypothetical protein
MFSTQLFSVHIFKGCFNCRNNASEETLHQEIPKGAKAARTRSKRGILPSSCKTIRVYPKLVLLINTATKKAFIQPLAFEDTEANIGAKTAFPCWEEFFKKIKKEEPLEYTPHSNPDISNLDDDVLPNIRRAYLHMVASQTPVFLCIELLK